MRNLSTLFTASLCLGFILIFNLIGQKWDMGGYNPKLDAPVQKAYLKPQIITSSPSEALFIEGQELILNTVVIGGATQFRWSKDGEAIQGVDKSILIIFGAQLANAGQYKLVAENEFGMAELTFNVQILERGQETQIKNSAPQIMYHTGGGRAILGKGFVLAVTATGESKIYRWYKNGQYIVNAHSRRLIFKSFQRTDEAHYEVEIRNDHGTVRRSVYVSAEREYDHIGES